MEGSPSYQYTGQGGLSWGIPYAAGVLALGWQVNPALDNDQIVRILFETCTIANDEGYGNKRNIKVKSEFFVMGLKIWQEELLFLVQRVQEKQHWEK